MPEVHDVSAAPGFDRGAVDALSEGLRGPLLREGDVGYDDARRVWNAMIDRRPALIARCAGAADVVRCVNFAREQDMLVGVRGGGHNVAGNAVCDGGLVIDLSSMNGIRVDPMRRTVRAEGGARWRELDHETQTFGLATPGGFISTTGIAGLTLGGGLAWLMRSYGLCCDNLTSADVVTADGRLLTANATENEDLFWGLRGGGGNFGVVTSFEYRLHPVGPVVLGGLVIHPIERAREVLRFFREFTQGAPDELTAALVVALSPDGLPIAGIATCYNGPVEAGERALSELRAFGPPVADLIGPIPYVQVQRMLDASYPEGRRNYWKSGFLRALEDDAIDTIIEHFSRRPSPLCHALIEHLGGAVRRADPDATAFGQRDADYNFTALAMWRDPAEDEACLGWARQFWDDMQAFSSGGVYVNYLAAMAEEGVDRVRAAYGDRKYERLVELKTKYDPSNLFCMNQNIPPTPIAVASGPPK